MLNVELELNFVLLNYSHLQYFVGHFVIEREDGDLYKYDVSDGRFDNNENIVTIGALLCYCGNMENNS